MLLLQNLLSNHIQNRKIEKLERNSLEDSVTEKYETIKEQLEKCFNEDPDNEILIQWKGNFENKSLNPQRDVYFIGQKRSQ